MTNHVWIFGNLSNGDFFRVTTACCGPYPEEDLKKTDCLVRLRSSGFSRNAFNFRTKKLISFCATTKCHKLESQPIFMPCLHCNGSGVIPFTFDYDCDETEDGDDSEIKIYNSKGEPK